MLKLLVILDSKKNSYQKEKNIFDKYGIRISQNIWTLNIHLKTFKSLIKKLKSITTKQTKIIFFKNNKIFETIGNNNKYFISKNKTKNIDLLKYAAKYHDLGKATKIFQDILIDKEKIKKYFIRHEYLSVLYIEFLIKKNNLIDLSKDDKYIVELNNYSFSEYLEKRLKYDIFIDIPNTNNLYLFLFLIGTHHILPNYNNNGFLINDQYLKLDRVIDYNDCKILLSNTYIDKLTQDIENIYQKNDNFFIDIKNIINNRNKIMLSDHMASSFNMNRTQKLNEELFNKTKIKAKGKKNFQSYREHTLLTQSKIKYSNEIFNNNIYSKLYDNYNDFIFEKSTNKNYQWQFITMNFVKKEINKDNPTLTFLGAKTGSGKTHLNLKLNLFFNKKRITILNTLRSLTLQTSSVYKDLNIFENYEINTIIGDKNIKKIYDINNLKNDEEKEYIYETNNISNKELKNYFNNFLSKSQEIYLDTPILITTIDNLINAGNLKKSKYLIPLLRLKTSNVIIDEIDNLGIEEQKSFLYFIYICGLYKVNVTISTATIYPIFAKAIYNSYNAGILNNDNNNFNLLYLSDQINIIQKENQSFDDFFKFKLNYTLKNNIEIKDLKIENFLPTILDLHNDNNDFNKENQSKNSIGFIRVAYIKNGKKIIKELLKQIEKLDKNEYNIEIIFYHSRYTIIERSYIEYVLEDTLNRKKDKLYAKRLFKDKKSKNNIVIVVATPIIEIGHDFDFDWSILEFSSINSCSQNCGRVFRHRDRNSNKTNIIILDKNFKLQENKKICYSKPGLEDENNLIENNNNKNLNSLIDKNEINFLQTNKPLFENINNNFAKKENNIINNKLSFYKNFYNIKEKDKYLFLSYFNYKFRQNNFNYNGYIYNNKCYIYNNKCYIYDNNSYQYYEIKLIVEPKLDLLNNIFNNTDYLNYKNKFFNEIDDNLAKKYNSFSLTSLKKLDLSSFSLKKEEFFDMYFSTI